MRQTGNIEADALAKMMPRFFFAGITCLVTHRMYRMLAVIVSEIIHGKRIKAWNH